MKKEKHNDHLWVCKQSNGMLGEIENNTPISAEQVQQVQQDPSFSQVICPDGQIVCNSCDRPLIGEPVKSGTIDFNGLKARLVKPSPKTS